MPNWCNTNMYFYGEKSIILDFHKKLTKWINADKSICNNSFGVSWLGNILGYTFGKDFVKEHEYDDNINFRGWVEFLDAPEKHKEKDVWLFNVTMESAWCPHITMWHLVIEKLYGKNANINIAYNAEETGMRLYCLCDPDHIIYDTENVYRVDAWDTKCKFGLEEGPCEYEEDELIEVIKDFFDISCTKDMLDDTDKLNEMIQDVIEESGQSEDDCGFYVYKYDIA